MNEYTNLRDFFDKNLSHIEINKSLESAIRRFRYSLLTKNPDMMELLSSNLTGVAKPSFTTQYTKNFFSEVLYADRDELQEEVFKVKGTNRKWKNGTNIYNLTIMYLIKRFIDKGLHRGAMDLYMLFGTRILVKLHEQYFHFPVKKELAEAVAHRMTARYLLKKLGTWEGVLKYRSKDFIDKKGVNYPRVMKFNTMDVIEAVNDGVNRIKSSLLQVYSLTIEVAESGEAITTVSSTIVGEEGSETIRDVTTGWTSYIENGYSIFTNRAKLHDKTYLSAVRAVTKNVPDKFITQVLERISNDMNSPKTADKTRKFIEDILTSTFTYLQEKGEYNFSRSNIHSILLSVANMWSVKRTQNNQYKLKDRMRSIVDKTVSVKTERVKQSLTIAVLCYIFLAAVLD